MLPWHQKKKKKKEIDQEIQWCNVVKLEVVQSNTEDVIILHNVIKNVCKDKQMAGLAA